MRFLIGGQGFDDMLRSRTGTGKCILFKYGPGSGGNMMLKQILSDSGDGIHSIFISTHESEEDLLNAFAEMDLPSDTELISFLNEMSAGMEATIKKDRFRTDGIMVTDLLEVSSNISYRKKRSSGGREVLSRISSISQKQVLSFKLVLDSLSDLVRKTSVEEVETRLQIMKRALKERNGIAVIGAPLGWNSMKEMESTLFDAVFSLRADNSGGTWRRLLIMENLKGSPGPPEEWEVTTVRSIPTARSLD
jgi:KaiC/GvpD/RAD55 family RecA-like ATPase